MKLKVYEVITQQAMPVGNGLESVIRSAVHHQLFTRPNGALLTCSATLWKGVTGWFTYYHYVLSRHCAMINLTSNSRLVQFS